MNELRHFLEEHCPDVVCLQELRVRDHFKLKIANYDVYTTIPTFPCNATPSRGTAILVKRNLVHHHIDSPLDIPTQTTAVNLTLETGKNLIIISIYVPCNHSRLGIKDDLLKLLSLGTEVIISGDFNAHHPFWNCSRENSAGKGVYEILMDEELQISVPDFPTHFSTYSASTIDFTIYRADFGLVETVSLSELTSDHNPIMTTFENLTPKRIANPLRATDWKKFYGRLGLYTAPLFPLLKPDTPNELDILVDKFTKVITKAHNDSQLPPRRADRMFIPKTLRELISWKNSLRKTWQRSRLPRDKEQYNTAVKVVKKEIKAQSNRQWNDLVERLSTEDKSIWKMTKALKRNKETKMGKLVTNGGSLITDTDKAEAIAEVMEAQFSPNEARCPDTEKLVEDSVGFFIRNKSHLVAPQIFPSELIPHLAKLKPNKSPGIHLITNKAVKNFPPSAILVFTAIINNILRLEHFPNPWKTAKVITIHKKGKDPKNPSSYRPISLLPTLGKITEGVILSFLNAHIQANNIIIPEQHGFRSKHSPSHQLLRAFEFIKEKRGKRPRPSAAVLFDIEKAFDRVWHQGLIHKLIELKFPNYLIRLIITYLTNRKFTVSIGGALSSERPINAGVPQGSKLGPILFLLYINDIPRHPRTLMALFADDTAILARHNVERFIFLWLQQHVKLIEHWLDCWRVRLNVQKTATIRFFPRRKSVTKIKVFNTSIDWTRETKYLGITLDQQLSMIKHTSETVNKVKKAVGILTPLLRKNSPLPISLKVYIYKAYIRPIITYASPVWSAMPHSYKAKLQTLQTTILRRISGARFFITNEQIAQALKVPALTEYIASLADKFYNSIPTHDNITIKGITNYDPSLPQNRYRPKATTLVN